MSLVGFRAQNHPQQVGVRRALDSVDDRETPPELFDPLNARFGFTLDVAAAAHNAKCARYFDVHTDGLKQSWKGERVWCNPPYSNLAAWALKALEQARHAELIVLLVPANRTEQAWWQDYVEPFRDRGRGLTVEFLRGRRRFIQHGRTEIKPNERPPFGVCLLIWGERESE